MDKLVEVLPYLDHPLVLAGFVIFLLFGLYKYLVQKNILHQVDTETNSKLVVTLVRNGFLIAILNTTTFSGSAVTNDIAMQEEKYSIKPESYTNEVLTERYQQYSTQADLPQEFSANYVLKMFGIAIARITYSLEHTESGLSITQSTRPAGIAALLRTDIIDVHSDMITSNGEVLLVNYDYKHRDDEKDRDVSFKINWQQNNNFGMTGNVTGIYEGKIIDITIDSPVWDPLSIQVPIMIDANKSMPPHVHGLFVKGEFKYYLFENHGIENIKFGGKQFSAVKIVGKETERDRAMYVWLAPELNNIPVKIEQWKEGKLKSTVLLESVTF